MCREELVTNITFKMLDAGMCTDVSCESALHSKRSETLVTFIRLLVGVDAYMAHEVTWFLELFGTVCTLVPSYSTHLKKNSKAFDMTIIGSVKLFEHKNVIIFLPISLSICFGCSKEPSRRDSSFEYPQLMFWLRNKKLILII